LTESSVPVTLPLPDRANKYLYTLPVSAPPVIVGPDGAPVNDLLVKFAVSQVVLTLIG
jgi:hypothetical protein